MKKRTIYQMSILVTTTIMVMGCLGSKSPVAKQATSVNKPVAQSSTASVVDLKGARFGTIALKGKKSYSQNQSIKFGIDTRGKTGYLYIVYLDNKGQTALLYPNEMSPLTELNGKYLFPRDFGGMHINATKDCKGCEQEMTTVYAVLSKEPISDIANITAGDLNRKSQGKGLNMSLASGHASNADINVGKIEFFVK